MRVFVRKSFIGQCVKIWVIFNLHFYRELKLYTMKTNRQFLASLVLLIGFFFSSTVNAQDSIVLLEQVEIRSARTSQLLKNSPEIIRVVTSMELQSLQISNVSDALEFVAGVNVETGTGSGFSNRGVASLNGMPSNYTLVLLNGNRLLTDHIHSGQNLNLISIEEIDRIEVIKTASSTQFGSDAIAGVVNIVTKKAGDQASATVFGEYGSYNSYRGGASVSTPISSKVGLYSFVDYSSSDGIPLLAPQHRIGQMAFNSLNLTQRINAKLFNRLDLNAWVKYIDNTMMWFDDAMDSHVFMPNIDFKYQFDEKSFITSKVAYSQWQSEINAEFNELLRPELFYSTRIGDNNEFLIGGDFSLQQFTRSKVTPHVQRMLGAFVQDKHQFGERLHLLASARLDVVQNLQPVITPKLALMYMFNPRLKLRASLSRGYHAPSVQELYEVGYGHGGTALRFGNPDLLPEYSTSAGLGLNMNVNNKLFVNVSGYFSDVTNMIVPVYNGIWDQDSTKDVWMRENILHAQILSAEASLSWMIHPNYYLFISYNYSDNIVQSDDARNLPYNPGQSLNFKFTANQQLTDKFELSEFVSLRSVYGRSAWNWKPESGSDQANPYGLTTELSDYQKLDAGIALKYAHRYTIRLNVTNILGQDIENLDDAYTVIDGEPVFNVGVSFCL